MLVPQKSFSYCMGASNLVLYFLAWGFPGSSAGKESAYNAGDPGSIPGSGIFPEEGIGYPLQYSGFSSGSEGKEAACNAGDLALVSGLGRSPEEGWQPTPIFLPEESHEQRSLEGYRPQGHKESDMTE